MEAIMWSHLSHPNLLPFYGIYHPHERLGSVCLVSPWMQNGNINDYLKVHPDVPRLHLVCTCAAILQLFLFLLSIKVHDTLAGLDYLHQKSIVHGDLKGVRSSRIWPRSLGSWISCDERQIS